MVRSTLRALCYFVNCSDSECFDQLLEAALDNQSRTLGHVVDGRCQDRVHISVRKRFCELRICETAVVLVADADEVSFVVPSTNDVSLVTAEVDFAFYCHGSRVQAVDESCQSTIDGRTRLADGEGFEPPGARPRRFSRPMP